MVGSGGTLGERARNSVTDPVREPVGGPAGRSARKDVAAGRNGLPAVLDAAWRGRAQALGQLIAAGAKLSVTDEDGNAPALAAAGGHRASLELILAAGADPNAPNRAGETALMLAAGKGNTDSVALLLGRTPPSAAAVLAGKRR